MFTKYTSYGSVVLYNEKILHIMMMFTPFISLKNWKISIMYIQLSNEGVQPLYRMNLDLQKKQRCIFLLLL